MKGYDMKMRLPLAALTIMSAVTAMAELSQPDQRKSPRNGAVDFETEPRWPTVTPEYYDYDADPASRMKGRYFTGKYISFPDKVESGKKVLLRRKFTLKENPKAAYFQGTGEFWYTYKINGKQILRSRSTSDRFSRDYVFQANPLAHLRKGENLIEADYTVESGRSGAILAEMLVVYADGKSQKFVTDSSFESSVDGGTTWKGVKEEPPAPTSERLTRLNYTDYEHPQRIIKRQNDLELKAGAKKMLSYTFAGMWPNGEISVRLKMFNGTKEVWFEEIDIEKRNRVILGDGKWRVQVPFEAPLYLPGGDYRIVLESNSIWCPGDKMECGLKLKPVAVDPKYPKPVESEVKRLNGRLQLTLDGRPFPLLMGATQHYARPDRKVRLGDMPYTVAVLMPVTYADFHPKFDVYNFSLFDRVAESCRREHPDSYFIFDLTFYPPVEFAEKYPEEMSCDEFGNRRSYGRFAWSYASRIAMDEMRNMVKKTVRYLEGRPYANRIIGYRVNSGQYTEWIGWSPASNDCAKDCSKPSQKAFREYAARFYPNIKNPHVPTVNDRRDLDAPNDILWNQKKHENAVAYNNFHCSVIVQDILELAGVVKNTLAELGRKKIFGTYYGYTHSQNFRGNTHYQGHFALQELIDNNKGLVDFLCSPQSYVHGRNFGGTCADMKAFGTMHASGILPIIEDDTRTHARYYPKYAASCNGAHTREQTRAILQRNSAIALCRGLPFYTYAITSGVEFSNSESESVGRDVKKAMDFTLDRPFRRSAEVALVASEKSIMALPYHWRYRKTGERYQNYNAAGVPEEKEVMASVLNGEIFMLAHNRFARAGAPVDYVLAEDLKHRPGNYRLYVFYNLFACDDETKAAVAKLRERGATILWLYAPGYLNGNSTQAMKELTGIEFAECAAAGDALVTVGSDGRMMGLPDTPMPKRFYPVKPDVVLGTYDDGKPGLAACRVGRSLNFFSGAWQLDQKFISHVYRESGVHVYSETGDPTEACDSFVTIHTRDSGRKRIRLPRKATVVDVFNHRLVAENVNVFEFDAPMHATYLFYYGKDAKDFLHELKKNPSKKKIQDAQVSEAAAVFEREAYKRKAGGDWKVVYSSAEGPQGRALQTLTERIGSWILRERHTSTALVLPMEKDGGDPVGTKKNMIVVGVPSENATLRRYIDADEVPKGGYLIKTLKDEDRSVIILAGDGPSEVLWAVFDFLDVAVREIEERMTHDMGGRYAGYILKNPQRLPIDYSFATAPETPCRSVFSWGHVIDDYNESFRAMARARFNRAILWNDQFVVNSKDVVDNAHSWGVKVYWGFSWGWTLSGKDGPVDFNRLADEVVADWRVRWKTMGGDGIYFQSFTETDKKTIGGKSIPDAVVTFVNAVTKRIRAEAPELDIVFGLHSNSMRYEGAEAALAKIDPSLEVLWENCGGFPYWEAYGDVSSPDIAFNEKILKITPKAGFAWKAQLRMDWANYVPPAGPFLLGCAGRRLLERDRRIISEVLCAYDEDWILNGKEAYRLIRHIRNGKNRPIEFNAVAEYNPPFAYATMCQAELFWNSNDSWESIMRRARMRSRPER